MKYENQKYDETFIYQHHRAIDDESVNDRLSG